VKSLSYEGIPGILLFKFYRIKDTLFTVNTVKPQQYVFQGTGEKLRAVENPTFFLWDIDEKLRAIEIRYTES